MTARLSRGFFANDTVKIAQALLGQRLVHLTGGERLSGIVVETEAYVGEDDMACHARAGRTTRTAVMYGPPGHAYVYFNYGIHWLFNVITEPEGFPAAVLVRALVPDEGMSTQRKHRHHRADHELSNGPAKLTQALAIDGSHNALDLCAPDATLFFEATKPAQPQIVSRPRVGLGKTTPEPWLSMPWNFRLTDA